ncbi:MAG: ABC-F family ATP-binding cassette domain-containing protein [Paludibacteraceae bacterium]|nr:ABC-F family ATP-binding cassette domain-containing protein [Paludibacteraceae bacterium]
MNAILQVEHLTKRFGDKSLFSDISFGVLEGQKVALVAKNGAGKTTLLSILAGEEDYQSGSVVFRRDLRVGYLRQHPVFPKGITVLDACPMPPDDDDWNHEARVRQILGKLDIHDLSQPIDQLSGGQQKRVALANVLLREPQLLILDEPTNHLDIEMVEWLEDFLRVSTLTLLMVTHDRYFLDKVCSDIYELDDDTIYHYRGNYSYFLEKKEERQRQQAAETQKARNLYRKELDWMRRQPQARATKARYRVEAFADIESRAKRRHDEKQVAIGIKAGYIGSKIFEANYVSKSFGDFKILDNFYYNFRRFDKVGIVGKNGTGKSTFLKLLLGQLKPDSGSFDIGQTVRFGYYSQEGLRFDEQKRVIDIVRDIADEVILNDGHRLSATALLQNFLFSPEAQYNYVYKLSGGEKRRLYLCTVLMRNPNFLILDEPTNDLDIATLHVLEDYLVAFSGCVLVVSHDRFFLDKVVDHILAFEGDGVVKDYPGNYTDYRDWRAAALLEEKATSAPEKADKPQREQRPPRPRRLSFKEKNELKALSDEIDLLEQEKKDIETQLSSSDLDLPTITRLSSRLPEIESRLDQITPRWLELSELGD